MHWNKHFLAILSLLSIFILPILASHGKNITYKGIKIYVTKPRVLPPRPRVLIYLSDIFGLSDGNKANADAYAREGNLVVIVPDLFDGDQWPLLTPPTLETFYSRYGSLPTDVVEGRIKKAVSYAKKKFNPKSLSATGYCFGGRYAFRVLRDGTDFHLAISSHPSATLLEEIGNVTKPIQIAASEDDPILYSPEDRYESERRLIAGEKKFEISVFSGVTHGFASAASVTTAEQIYAKEAARKQAIHWIQTWG